MNLKEWAATQGIAYVTARRRYASGTLPVPTYRLGRLIMVGDPNASGLPAMKSDEQVIAAAARLLLALCVRAHGQNAATAAREAIEAVSGNR